MHDTSASLPSATGRLDAARRGAVAAFVLAGALTTLTSTTPPAEASTTPSTCAATAHPTGVKPAVAGAKAALAKALADVQAGQYAAAATQLHAVRHQVRVANTVAMSLIGKPPTDPESDDPPGVTAVLQVGALDHRITMALVPLFSGPAGHQIARPLGKGLNKAVGCRDRMLGQVIALRPGARDDYVDGLSDTLPSFHQELTAIATPLAGSGLTTAGRAALVQAQQVVSATTTAMEKVFGGGERSPGPR